MYAQERYWIARRKFPSDASSIAVPYRKQARRVRSKRVGERLAGTRRAEKPQAALAGCLFFGQTKKSQVPQRTRSLFIKVCAPVRIKQFIIAKRYN
jgi:hypothetical protein